MIEASFADSESAPALRRWSRTRQTDVAIIGGGLAGALAAVVLGRAGHRVTLLDRHAVYPSEFRVEKLAGHQIALLRRLGLLDVIAPVATRYDEVVNVRRGQIIDRTYGEQYGILYSDLVKVARNEMPSSVEVVIDRVVDI